MKANITFGMFIALLTVFVGMATFLVLRTPAAPVSTPAVVFKDIGYTKVNDELVRTDDHERGISCYYFKEWRRALSCVPMRDN